MRRFWRKSFLMSERRPHWDDELIESLPIPGHSYLEDEDIYAIIAAVEDWQDANGFSRAGTLMHRLIDAEAAIQRVREVLERYRTSPYSEMSQTDALGAVLNALDGDNDA